MSSTLFAFADAGDGVLISETRVERFQIVLALAFGVLVVVGSLWIMDQHGVPVPVVEMQR